MERTAGFHPGLVVIAMAGRESGSRYVVVGLGQNCLLLADGLKRPVDKPKRKNPRHVKVIGGLEAGRPGGTWTNERVKQALRAMEGG